MLFTAGWSGFTIKPCAAEEARMPAPIIMMFLQMLPASRCYRVAAAAEAACGSCGSSGGACLGLPR